MITELIIVAICLSLNALLACFEMAFVSVSRPQLRQLAQSGNQDAQRLLSLRDTPERTLSIIQVGITLVGAVSAAVGGAGAEETLSPFFMSQFGWGEGVSEAIAIVFIVVPLTFLSVVVGELVPKSIALKRPLQIAFFGSRWLLLTDRILYPAVNLFEGATKFVLKYLLPQIKPERVHEGPGTAVEIDSLSEHHRQYILNLAHLEIKRIKDIMVHWSEVATVEHNKSSADAVAVMIQSGHSRIPVIENNEVIGFLYSKEFLALSASGDQNWNSIIRPILRVYENDSLLRVMRLMQDKRTHMSLVSSNDKKLVGIVTLEDIIEEVVGEIYDENDDGILRRILAASGKLRGTRFGGSGPNPALFEPLAQT